MAPPLLAATAASTASRSTALRWLLAGLLVLPVLLVVLLVVLLGGELAADAAAVGAPGQLRAGAVPAGYEPLLRRAGRTCAGVTTALLAAQIAVESGWNLRAVSPAGAQGLAQFMPATWAGAGVDGDGDGRRDPFNPADAIVSQAAFLCQLLAAVTADRRLVGDPLDLALAAYNAGLGAVQRADGVPPYPETQNYVRRIRALIADYAHPAGTAPGAGPPGSWARPITGPLTSGFGLRWGRLHAGTDFAAPVGTPVYAASDGTVVAAGPASGFGKWVKITHPGGVSTVYGHISRWTVTVGQAVRSGQLIAYSGNEGRSTGPHLHLETHVNGRAVDPAAFYPPMAPSCETRADRRARFPDALASLPGTRPGRTGKTPRRTGKTPAADGQDSAAASHTFGQDFGQDRARTVTSMTPTPRASVLRDGRTTGPVRAFSAANLAIVVSHLLDEAIDTATSPCAIDKECREQD